MFASIDPSTVGMRLRVAGERKKNYLYFDISVQVLRIGFELCMCVCVCVRVCVCVCVCA